MRRWQVRPNQGEREDQTEPPERRFPEFRKRVGRRLRSLRTISVLPTLFTLGNLVCGFFAIVIASRVAAPQELTSFDLETLRGALTAPLTNAMYSAWLIFLAMVFDALDGHVARLSRTSSDFGAELDSLCDVVSFGVAPAFLLVKICPQFAYLHREAVWVMAAAYVACAALRLARFNVETGDEDDHLTFSGLPSPAAAASIASFAIIFYTLIVKGESAPPFADKLFLGLQGLLPFFALLAAFLMVSRIPYPHVVNQIFRGQRNFSHVVKLIFALVAIMVIRGYAVPIVCCIFVLGSPIRYFWEKLVHKRHQEDPMF